MDFTTKLEMCRSLSDTFELVREVCSFYMGMEQNDLMIGLSDMGKLNDSLLGAFYSPFSNVIVINSRILRNIRRRSFYKPFLFHILLHEYVHSLGFFDEKKVREITYMISLALNNKIVTQLAADMKKFTPDVVPSDNFEEETNFEIVFLPDIGKGDIE